MTRSGGRSKARGLQTTIHNHFRSVQGGESSKVSKKSSTDSLVLSNGKRKKISDSDGKPAKKRRGDSRTPEAHFSNSEEGDDTATAFDHNFIAQSLFGLAPHASLTPQARTPRRTRKISTIALHAAPAISPSKRRSLLTDTQRDAAMQQQHRRSPRSSSPLRPIENTVRSGTGGGRMTRSNSTSLTPSKLRHGYSLLAFDEADEHQIISSECIDGEEQSNALCDPSEQENSPSPSAERCERADSAFRLAYTRSPKSKKRIYAQETLQTPQSPLDKYNEMRERELKEICERYGSGKNANDVAAGSSQDTVPLSSPPPSSPGAFDLILRDADNLSSSQTAPGGSFSIQRDDIIARPEDEGRIEGEETVMLETYMSEEEAIEDDIRRGCGDETFRLPSSQEIQTPFRVHKVKRALRSSTKSKEKEKQTEAELDLLEGEETQPLSWSPSKEAAERQSASHKKRDRIDATWHELGKVWDNVNLPTDQRESQLAKARQSSLHKYGFSREGRMADEAGGQISSVSGQDALTISNDVVFASDEEVDSDMEEHGEEDPEETQELLWSDEVAEEEERGPTEVQRRENCTDDGEDDQGSQGQSQLMMLMLPDEDDLDTQGRDWLDRL